MLIQCDLEPILGVTLSPEHASQIVTPVTRPVVSLGQGKHVSVFVLWYSPISHATEMCCLVNLRYFRGRVSNFNQSEASMSDSCFFFRNQSSFELLSCKTC